MKINDIVNKDIANLVNCESEPIHIPGSIQPHGFLLALNRDTLNIDFCSDNCAEYINLDATALLNRNIEDITNPADIKEFKSYLAGYDAETAMPFAFTLAGSAHNATIHFSNNAIILECEPVQEGSMSQPSLYLQTRKFVAFMESGSNLQPLCQKIAEETREITGYDRVMIYRFDKEYNGEVFAESKREDLNGFLGHHYPHTDIPVQARELYMRNLMRMIVDVNYIPVALLTADDNASNKSLDLSLSVLRSVSPIHIQYLKNMGVGATLVISLIHNKKLWGLISCHHYSAKNLPHYKRLAAQLQGHFLTSQINVRQVAEEFEVNQRVDAHLKTLQGILYDEGDFMNNIVASPAFTALTNAGGAAIFHNGKLYKSGTLPSDEQLTALTDWLKNTLKKESFDTDNLSAQYPAGKELSEIASGIIFYSLGRGDCILWVRPEIEKTINWAGHPDEAVVKDDSPTGLSPRKSFELWQQIVKYKSRDWCKGELNVAMLFATSLQKQMHLIHSRNEEERYRKVNLKLKTVNKELENINWITTHDLKEPLRKIQIFASKLLDNEEHELPTEVNDTIGRMSNGAKKMQQLIDDMVLYAQAGNIEKASVSIDMNKMVADILEELNEDIEARNARFDVADIPAIQGVPFQVKQLFINLFSNALKFSKDDTLPVIKVTGTKVTGAESPIPDAISDNHYTMITISDNGIGFENEHAEKVFSVFQRLHDTARYKGTGIGLAICRKIMETHEGFIKAASKPGEGAAFTLLFPEK